MRLLIVEDELAIAELEKEEQEFILDSDRLSAVLEFKRNPDNSKMNETLKKDLRLFGVIIRNLEINNLNLTTKNLLEDDSMKDGKTRGICPCRRYTDTPETCPQKSL